MPRNMESKVPYNHVLVPIHGNPCDYRAIELARSVVNEEKADLTLVYVVEVAQSLPLEVELPQELEEAERSLQKAEAWAKESNKRPLQRVTPELLQARSAGAAIVDEAIERGADLIVMALENHKRHGRPTVGETVPYVLKNAPCEVLIARMPPSNGLNKCDWQPSLGEEL